MTPDNTDQIDDYKELISAFNKHRVEYIIVGAYAVGRCGFLRFTQDLDLLVNPEPGNAKKVAAALKEFGGYAVNPEEIREKTIIQLGVKPAGLDIMTTITGVSWGKAWSSRVQSEFGNQPAAFLSKECLIENKRATHREKDNLDLINLGAGPVSPRKSHPKRKKSP